jgi:hypothetical protein
MKLTKEEQDVLNSVLNTYPYIDENSPMEGDPEYARNFNKNLDALREKLIK